METTVLPYRLHPVDGQNGALDHPSTVSLIDRFMAGNASDAMLAPYAGVRVSEDRLEVAQDWIGSGRVFVHANGDLVLATNCLRSARAAVGSVLDEEAMAMFAGCGYLLGDQSFDTRFRLLPPAGRLEATIGTHGPRIRRSQEDTPWLEGRPEPTPTDLIDILSRTAQSILSTEDQPIRLGLSGGRDSRLLAAILLKAGAQIDFSTTNNFSDETETVRTLLRTLNLQDRLTVKSPAPSTGGYLENIFESARGLVAAYDGLYEPTYIGLEFPQMPGPLASVTRATINGAMGEMLHRHFYPPPGWSPSEKTLSMSRSAAIDYLGTRICAGVAPSPLARDAVKGMLHTYLDRAPKMDHGLRVLDYYYAYVRQRRWAPISGNNAACVPMASKAFSMASFGLPVESLYHSTMPKRMTDAVMPEWRDVPYFKAKVARVVNRPVVSRPDARVILERLRAAPLTCALLNTAAIADIVQSAWEDTPPARRDAALRRALWLVEVEAQFAP